MNPRPQVSVVLPVRNGAATLPAVLADLRAQTLTAWELVAVDDGSTDGTAELLRHAARGDGRIVLLSPPPRGIVTALQHGCAVARGQFIARMDADDAMTPDRLARQAEFLEAHPAIGLVSCRVAFGGDARAQAGYAAHVAWLNTLLTPERIALRRFIEAPVAHPSVMFRRELLARHGGYADGDFPEDYELWLRWLDAGVRFAKVDAELVRWNDSPRRLSRTDSRYRPVAFYRLKCEYLARWLRKHVTPERAVWLWGAGRVTRQRFCALEEAGVRLAGFVDVDRKKWGRQRDGRPVVGPDNLPPRGVAFILAGVGTRGARELIAAELERRGWIEGTDFLLAA
jgi:glycosyltransferase involved in cell wall biosynthesis